MNFLEIADKNYHCNRTYQKVHDLTLVKGLKASFFHLLIPKVTILHSQVKCLTILTLPRQPSLSPRPWYGPDWMMLLML